MHTDTRLTVLFSALLLLGTTSSLSLSACSSDEAGTPPGREADEDDDEEQTTDESTADDEDDESSTARKDAGPDKRDAAPRTMSDAARVNVDATVRPADAAISSGDGGAEPTDAGIQDPPTSGHFPRSAEQVSVARRGPYTFKTYTQGLNDPAYSSSIMYYPVEAEPPFAAIVFAPGYTASKEDYTVLAEIFASHGFAMLLTTPTNTNSDQPPARGKDLVAAVARIKLENERSGSPLQGKLAADRVCVTGQSMGGGGTLHAANELGNKIRCAVPLQSWQPNGRFPNIVAPTLFIAAQSDTVAAVAQHAWPHYQSIPASTDKTYAEFKGADHFLSTNRAQMMDEQAHYMVAFYKLHLEDDERYRPFLYGDKQLMSALSRYEYSKK